MAVSAHFSSLRAHLGIPCRVPSKSNRSRWLFREPVRFWNPRFSTLNTLLLRHCLLRGRRNRCASVLCHARLIRSSRRLMTCWTPAGSLRIFALSRLMIPHLLLVENLLVPPVVLLRPLLLWASIINHPPPTRLEAQALRNHQRRSGLIPLQRMVDRIAGMLRDARKMCVLLRRHQHLCLRITATNHPPPTRLKAPALQNHQRRYGRIPLRQKMAFRRMVDRIARIFRDGWKM